MPAISLPRKLVPPNLQVFVIPLMLLAALGTIFLFAVRYGFSRISTQRSELETVQKDENILSQKESLLKEVQTDVPSYVKVVAAVMPEKNPSLAMISQLKFLAASRVLVVENIKVGGASGEDTGLSNVQITFGVDGPFDQVVDFIESIKTLAPVSTLEKVKINQSTEGTRADVTLKVYYAAFPQKLPSLTEPARQLTTQEKETLTNLSGLSLPAIIELTPQSPNLRESPFD